MVSLSGIRPKALHWAHTRAVSNLVVLDIFFVLVASFSYGNVSMINATQIPAHALPLRVLCSRMLDICGCELHALHTREDAAYVGPQRKDRQ